MSCAVAGPFVSFSLYSSTTFNLGLHSIPYYITSLSLYSSGKRRKVSHLILTKEPILIGESMVQQEPMLGRVLQFYTALYKDILQALAITCLPQFIQFFLCILGLQKKKLK